MTAALPTTSLTRNMDEGDEITFDGGRIIMRFEKRYGRSSRVHFVLDAGVTVSKPGLSPARQRAANDSRI